MKTRIVRLLLWLLNKLVGKDILTLVTFIRDGCGYTHDEILSALGITAHPVPDSLAPVVAKALELITQVQTSSPDTSGEFKRHYVLSRMLRDKIASHREISLAIELALYKQRGGL